MEGADSTVVELILEALDPSVVVRVGAVSDASVATLADAAARRGAVVHAIDPAADPAAVDWGGHGESLVLHRTKGLNGLARVPDAELVILDGEHNWYTVTRALETLEKRARSTGHAFPLVLVTAVDWPYGRRDAYPDPDSVPEAFRHAFRRGGLVPGQEEPVEQGGLEAGVAHALTGGGPRNGVRSAIEDFIAGTDLDVALVDVPGMHGLGIVATAEHRRRGRKLGRLLRRLGSEPFLAERVRRVEEMRLRESLAVAGMREEVQRNADALETLREQLDAERAAAAGALEAARRDAAEAEQRVVDLGRRLQTRQGELDAALSRSHAAIEARSRAKREEAGRRRALEEESDAMRAELLAAERRVLVRDRELAVRQTELEAARRRLQRLDAEAASGRSALEQRRAEREAAQKRLAEVERAAKEADRARGALAEQVATLERAAKEADRERRALAEQVTSRKRAAKEADRARRALTEQVATLERQHHDRVAALESRHGDRLEAIEREHNERIAGLEHQLQELQAELASATGAGARLQAKRTRLEADLQREAAARADIEARLAEATRRHEQVVSQTTLALEEVKGDLERVARSRAWRWGHRLAVASWRLTFRRRLTQGAVATAIERIERIEAQRRALDAARPATPARPQPAPAGALSFCIKIGAPDWQAAVKWGDLYFAEALQRELERRGHGCLIQVLEEWDAPEGLAYDVALHLKGTARYHVRPEQLNVLWGISHPDMLSSEECDAYDLVCVASERFASRLRSRTRTPVVTIDQATDPAIFFPDRDPAFEHELVFVGNSRNVMRPVLRDLLPTEHELAVFGGQWEGLIDKKYVVRDRVPNGDLRKVYSSAAIVLNDHWDDMRQHGFISNRIYDALACGAFVISDHVPELVRRFDGAVQTYDSRAELQQLIDRYARAPEERHEFGLRGRELVLQRHTFSHRVDELLAAVTTSR